MQSSQTIKVTLESLADAAEVAPSVVKEGVREINERLFSGQLRQVPQKHRSYAGSRELQELASDLLAVGLKEKTVRQVLKDLHPELNRWHVGGSSSS